MRAYERLLNYVKFDTMSDENSQTCPSTDKQKVLGEALVKEMKEIGIENAFMDEFGYVYGSIPATAGCENEPAIGLIAHMDTAPDMTGANVNPRIIENYDGKDIVLNEQLGIVMDVKRFPQLKNYEGQSLIVTDGTTLLGADDKAGIAEIMTAADEIISGEKPHGKICIGFTPDEEIGCGADHFNVKGFGADFAYTLDGSILGEIEYENFNAASAKIHIHGENIHPGSAKNKMKNALLIGMELNSMLPPFETPAHTEGYEGFYHLGEMHGDEENTFLSYIIRDHDMVKFNDKKARMEKIVAYLNDKYGEGTVEAVIKDSYYNMREIIEKNMFIIDRAVEAFKENGIEAVNLPIRGGTDGARLSFMGLPCPNLSTGGDNYHGKYEYACIESMDKMVEVVKSIIIKK